MKPRDAPYKELTDPRNERITATLTPRSWAKLTVLATRSRFFGMDLQADDWLSPDDTGKVPNAEAEASFLQGMMEHMRTQDILIHEARQSSGSIGGKHRSDLVDALQGPGEPKQGLSVQDVEPEGL